MSQKAFCNDYDRLKLATVETFRAVQSISSSGSEIGDPPETDAPSTIEESVFVEDEFFRGKFLIDYGAELLFDTSGLLPPEDQYRVGAADDWPGYAGLGEIFFLPYNFVSGEICAHDQSALSSIKQRWDQLHAEAAAMRAQLEAAGTWMDAAAEALGVGDDGSIAAAKATLEELSESFRATLKKWREH